MSVNDGPAALRQFVAHPPFWGSKLASKTTPAWQNNPVRSYLIMVVAIVAFCVVFGGLYMGVQLYFMRGPGGSRPSAEIMDKVLRYGFVVILLGAVGAWYWWSQRSQHGKILIDVTSNGLTVNKRPGDVYPFSDAKLGVWGVSGGMTMGTTLHLHCGQRPFILGGRDHRVVAGTRLEAPDAGYGLPVDVDAWVGATDFDEILTMAGRHSNQSRLDASPLAPAEPTRCLLFPNPLLIQQMGPFAFRQKQQLLQSVNQPRLAIDVGTDAIRVIDPNTNALIASARLAQVSATPETYQYRYGRFLFGSLDQIVSRVFEQSMAASLSTTPVVVVCIPGVHPLSIGCRDTVGGLDPLLPHWSAGDRRFSWLGNVRQRMNEPPDFAVSGVDWLTLVEKLGLTSQLEDKARRYET